MKFYQYRVGVTGLVAVFVFTILSKNIVLNTLGIDSVILDFISYVGLFCLYYYSVAYYKINYYDKKRNNKDNDSDKEA